MAAKIALLLGSLLLCGAAAEWGFASFYRESDGFLQSRAAARWMAEHWRPLNRAGYRDAEPDPQRLATSRILVVLGDSFAAGHGIENHEDRFPNLLRSALGPDWSLILLAVNGWQTGDELEALQRLRWRPEHVVLSYYVNDIADAAARHGRTFDLQLARPTGWLATVTSASDLADFLYWRILRSRQQAAFRQYGRFLADAFADPGIWRDHATKLRAIQSAAGSRGAGFSVVIFPNLADLAGSREMTNRVGQLFRQSGANVIDLAEAFADRPRSELVVNANDAHPNQAVHREVAQLLFQSLLRSVESAPQPASPPRSPSSLDQREVPSL